MAGPLTYSSEIKIKITEYYLQNYAFPRDNAEARLPAMDKLISNEIEQVEISNGAFHITLGNKLPSVMHGKILTFRPAVVIDSPTSQIAWLCGYSKPVNGMEAVGENKTDVNSQFLPSNCVDD